METSYLYMMVHLPTMYSTSDPGQNTELKELPPYSPFLNIVEQSISSLKAAV